ncbi:hypothetical protein [Micromonospora avicenniae]|uniref:Tryptophan-associated transmembrane protein (Trp_oprn_chp) n=1 Tax=Micromonospora avicenniae TaxID=1198245 RepID=A0A1N6TKQ6_9ACTN|nr:hypothetical protein [Micromonospora avicenniae]SIQ53913.1 hypothetical protein SAMN05444858_10318 [Micromonospora avicenniae]
MSRELPIQRQDDRSDDMAVIEWGTAEPDTPERPRRSLAGLGRDRRIPQLLAGLGALAGVASLVGEWVVMTLPDGGREGSLEVPAGVADVNGFGVGYLVGLLGLVCAVALALRGTPTVRPNARVLGLALAGALLVLLTVTASELDDSTRRLFYSPEEGFRIEYGRGLAMAFVACVLLAAALQLAPNAAPLDEDAPAGAVFRRRRRSARDEPDDVPPPADLTVQPAVPFARPESQI